jgi:hypothetical protein
MLLWPRQTPQGSWEVRESASDADPGRPVATLTGRWAWLSAWWFYLTNFRRYA